MSEKTEPLSNYYNFKKGLWLFFKKQQKEHVIFVFNFVISLFTCHLDQDQFPKVEKQGNKNMYKIFDKYFNLNK